MAGDYYSPVSASSTVDIEGMNTIDFGKWSGVLTFTISMSDKEDYAGSDVSINKISFTVGENTYYAEEGMNWKEWSESDWMPKGAFTVSSEVYSNLESNLTEETSGSPYVRTSSGTYCAPTQVLRDGYSYRCY